MRSKLFVPGARPLLFDKALASGADAISFDLEDSVLPEGKAQARQHVTEYLRTAAARSAHPRIIVRTNALNSPHFASDIFALVGTAVGMLNLPKIECAEDVVHAVALLEHAERACPGTAPLQLLCTVETPKALRNAAQIALAHPRVVGLQLGLGDLFEPARISRREQAHVHAAMFALRMAAAEAGVFALDGAYPVIDDAEGFRAEAHMAHSLGYIGKSCIHPSQVALAHEVFSSSADEAEFARRVVAAAAQGQGVFVLDGKMIDGPYLKRAQALVAATKSPP